MNNRRWRNQHRQKIAGYVQHSLMASAGWLIAGNIWRACLVIMVSFLPIIAQAQYMVNTWTTADGLPVNSVNAVVQGQDGYIWLATYDGLVRFDGVRFTVFNTSTHPNLPSNRFTSLIGTETEEGALWLMTEQNHLIRFQENQFTVFGAENGLPHDDVTTLLSGPDGSLFIGTHKGVVRYYQGNIEKLGGDEVTGHIFSLLLGPDKSLWIGTDHEVLRLESDGDIHPVLSSKESSWFPVESLALVDSSIWIGATSGILVWQDGVVEPLQGPEELTQRTAFDIVEAGGAVWLNTDEGVYGYRDGQIIHRPDPAERGVSVRRHPATMDETGALWVNTGRRLIRDGQTVFRSEAQLYSVITDREENFWIPAEDGLHRLRFSPFETYRKKDGLRYENIYPIFESSDGMVWLGTLGGGLARIRDDTTDTYGAEAGVPDVVWALEESRNGSLWVGGAGLCRFQNGLCRQEEIPPKLTTATIRAIHQHEDGSTWFGTAVGLYRLKNGTWRHFTPEDGVPLQPVRVFLEDAGGVLWMGTNGGGIIRLKDETFTVFTSADGLCSDLIRALYVDVHGALWAGTEDRGLCRIGLPEGDLSGATVIQVDRRHGLYDHSVHRILNDGTGRLWMSGNQGIWWVMQEDLDALAAGEKIRIHSTAYTERSGLPTREANGGVHPAGIRASDGRLWFPTQAGAVVFDPRNLPRNELRPAVHIEEIAIGLGEERREIVGTAVTGPLVLAPGERQMEIVYTAPSFIDPASVRFRYRLEGFDEDWVEADTRRLATYTNLRPGTYRFHVIAANRDGVWNETGAAFRLQVQPHWYETRTFLVMCAMLLLATGLMAGQWRRWKLKRRQHELEAQVEERTGELSETLEKIAEQAAALEELDKAKSRFFANISHEFRTPLTVILGGLKDTIAGRFGKVPEKLVRHQRAMLYNTRRLQHLIEQILDLNRLESGNLKLISVPGDLVRFLRRMIETYSPLAERNGIDLTLNCEAEHCPRLYDEDKLAKIIGNLLSNALKFTPRNGKVHVSLHCENDSDAAGGRNGKQGVEISVTDNGPGIPFEAQERIFERFVRLEESAFHGDTGTGIGLALARELTELHGGTIALESEPGEGSTFTVWLPLKKAGVSDIQKQKKANRLPDQVPVPVATIPRNMSKAGKNSADRTTVLVIEDNEDVRAYIRRSLEETCRVIEAPAGDIGLNLAFTALPDLVVSDVMLPGINGYEIARRLKAEPDTECIPVVMLTARAGESDHVEGYGSGAEAYLTKPFSPETLRAVIARLLEERQRLRRRLSADTRNTLRQESAKRGDGKEYADKHMPLITRARIAVLEHLYDEEFSVVELANALHMSRPTLYRRLNEESETSPGELIRTVRLEHARELLSERAGSVSEVAYATGFKSLSHFTHSFREQYGKTPSSILGSQ